RDLVAAQANPGLRATVTDAERNVWNTDIYALQRAEPFYWNNRTVELVSATMSAFKLEEIECRRHLLWNDVAWHWFSGRTPFTIELPLEGGGRRPIPINAITTYWFRYQGKPYLGATAWSRRAILRETGELVGAILPAVWICVDEGQMMDTTLAPE